MAREGGDLRSRMESTSQGIGVMDEFEAEDRERWSRVTVTGMSSLHPVLRARNKRYQVLMRRSPCAVLWERLSLGRFATNIAFPHISRGFLQTGDTHAGHRTKEVDVH